MCCFFVTKALAFFQHGHAFELWSFASFISKDFFFTLYLKSVWKLWPAASPPCSSALRSLHSPRSQDLIALLLAFFFLLLLPQRSSSPPSAPPPLHPLDTPPIHPIPLPFFFSCLKRSSIHTKKKYRSYPFGWMDQT